MVQPLTDAERLAIARRLDIAPSDLVENDDADSDPGYVFRYFFRFVDDPETDHLVPDIRMVRLYVRGLRAFLEWRCHPDRGPGDRAVVCPALDISEREVMAVWKARPVAVTAAPRLGRPPGPTPGVDEERWRVLAEQIGLPAAKAKYDAVTPRRAGRSIWWRDKVAHPLRRQKLRQK